MAWEVNTTYKNAIANQLRTTVGNNGTIVWLDGTMPAIGDADAGTVIGTTALSADTSWLADASGGVSSLSATRSTTASATGLIRYARLKTSGGTVVGQGTVTDLFGNGDFKLTSTTIAVVGQQILLVTFNHGF